MEKCEILSRLILMIEDVDGPLGFKPAHFFLFGSKKTQGFVHVEVGNYELVALCLIFCNFVVKCKSAV